MTLNRSQPGEKGVHVLLFRNFKPELKNHFRNLYSQAMNTDPEYVIFSGADNNESDAVIAYKSSRAALVLSQSPATMAFRGEVHNLKGDSVYFIPPEKNSIFIHRLWYSAAAALILLLTAGLFYWSNRPSTTTQDQTLAARPADIPAAYFDYELTVPADRLEVLVASNQDEAKDHHQNKLNEYIADLLWDSILDVSHLQRRLEIIPFYEAVINHPQLSEKNRKDALDGLYMTAYVHDKKPILLKYLEHNESFIREATQHHLKCWEIRANKKKNLDKTSIPDGS